MKSWGLMINVRTFIETIMSIRNISIYEFSFSKQIQIIDFVQLHPVVPLLVVLAEIYSESHIQIST